MKTLGIDARMQPVYRVLLELGESDAGDLAARVGQDESSVRAALARLAGLSLVRRRPGDRRTWCAVAPELGLGALLDRQEAELDRRRREVDESRGAVASLLAAHRPHRSPDDPGLTGLQGPEEIRLALDRLCRGATEEILVALPADPHALRLLLTGDSPVEAAPALGVRVRALHLAAGRHGTHHLHGRRLGEAGAEVRAAARLSAAVIVVDRAGAVVAVPGTSTSRGGTALPRAELVTSPALVAALTALFDRDWEAALPATTARGEQGPGAVPRPGIDDQERALLHLLGEGLTDEVAARRLGVSLRTVRRIVSGLLARHGSRSRFQLGVLTGTHGWLRDPRPRPAAAAEPAVRRTA